MNTALEPATDDLVSPDGRWRWDGERWLPAEVSATRIASMPERLGHRSTAEVLAPPPPQAAAPSSENETATDLDSLLVAPGRSAPRHGLRGLVHRLSGGAIAIGPNHRELSERRRAAQVRTPLLDQPHLIAVGTEKGGVGKTTISILLGAALALERHHPVPYPRSEPAPRHQRGLELLRRSDPERDIEVALPSIHRYTSLVDELGLEAMTAPLDPGRRQVLGAEEYRRAFSVLYRYYPILCLDQGTGTHDSGTEWVWRACDQAVVVTPATLDGAKLTDHTLDFLAARRRLDEEDGDREEGGREWLKRRAVVVLNHIGEGGRAERRELDLLRRHFRRRARAVCLICFDRHLAAGRRIELHRMGGGVRDDLRGLAAEVASGFAIGFAPDAVEASGRG